MQDYLNKIKDKIADELEDSMSYSHLAKEAKESGSDGCAQILKDMAEEEFEHAKHIEYILDHAGIQHPDMHEKMHMARKML
jgi:rubrerythrin